MKSKEIIEEKYKKYLVLNVVLAILRKTEKGKRRIGEKFRDIAVKIVILGLLLMRVFTE